VLRRVPRRARSPSSRPATNATLSADTSSTASYVTLTARAELLLKMIFGRTTFIAGVPLLSSYPVRRAPDQRDVTQSYEPLLGSSVRTRLILRFRRVTI